MNPGWKKKTIGHLFDVQLGKMLSEKAKAGPQVPYLANFNVRWGAFDLSKLNEMNFSDREKDKYKLQKGDLLMCEGGEIGRCAIWQGSTMEVYYQKALHRVRPKCADVSTDFLYFYMQFIASQGKLTRLVGETSIAHLTREKLLGLPITFPVRSEQKAIADLLSTWDEAIEKTERLILAKEKRFKRLLNDLIHLPAKEDIWEQMRMKSLFKERKEGKRGDLPLLSITNSLGVIPHGETNRKDSSNKDKSKYLRICPGDIGYNTMRMWQGVSALSSLEGIVSPAYTICIPCDQLNPRFVAYLFKTPFMIHRFYQYSQGLTSDTWNLKFRHFSEVKMPLPSLEKQERIAETLSAAQEEIDLLKQITEKYKIQKRGLMQKMLAGEWRVKPEIVNQYMEV